MKRGFSLVELSIVLVILALLTGGILAGKSLIRASELRAVAVEHQRYLAAVVSFRNKYSAVPGDFRDATWIWGTDSTASNCITNSSAPNAATGTCDGNGDGTINQATAVLGASGEMFQFWRQLAAANIIEGTYTGVTDTASSDSSLPGTNIPASRLSLGAWSVSSGQPSVASTYTLAYGNHFLFGSALTGNVPAGSVLKPEEAWNIDTKLDDGKPARGFIVARSFANSCGTADDGSTHTTTNLDASYKLSNNAIACALYFIQAF